ncbi:hypothetical protein [Ornithinimicrobium kibberense]|uniref:hypothetical protein n=1 Tax=Ornithinimicrobium kibberense TaxID=282060 RepID=UPI00361CE182
MRRAASRPRWCAAIRTLMPRRGWFSRRPPAGAVSVADPLPRLAGTACSSPSALGFRPSRTRAAAQQARNRGRDS